MEKDRPVSREKNVSEGSKGVHRRGDGLGIGQVGNGKIGNILGGGSSKPAHPEGPRPGDSGHSAPHPGGPGHNGPHPGGPGHSERPHPVAKPRPNGPTSPAQTGSCGGTLFKWILIIAIIVIVCVYVFGDDTDTSTTDSSTVTTTTVTEHTSLDTPMGTIDNTVAEGSRSKYTTILGNGEDTVTLMVYMCGTDLESKYGMATNDLNEMMAATISDKINLIVYTGGCTQWKNSTVSSSTNQIYQIKNGQMILIEDNLGSVSMTDPATLTGFIQYCSGNFPANRYELILWDHGGGSVSGYGYDQKFSNYGSMNLAGIKTALNNGGVKFDFVGFDACLMATLENGLMLADYADYMIASEETEPGVGWYYTNWLTALSNDTSISTVELGSKIVDDFVSVCAKDAYGQMTTLSVVDLAELSNTVPDRLRAFSTTTADMIQNNNYQQIANARSGAREFAKSSKIDQVDIINLAQKIGTTEATELADAVSGAVKYNRTSSNMTNAYGVSVYFPFRKLANVDSALQTYNAIGMDSEYSRCIREYAALEVDGQSAANENSYGLGSLFSLFGISSSGDWESWDDRAFFTGREMSIADGKEYVSSHSFDASALKWTEDSEGNKVIALTDSQWELITDVELSMFVDDGTGYVDMGLDNLYEFNENGDLIASTDKTWIAINNQPVAYYYMYSESDGDDYSITGYVPAMLNGERVKLILNFTDEEPKGYIAGAMTDYSKSDISVEAKNICELTEGDKLEFICDYYSYDGEFEDSYYLGEPMTVTANMQISNVSVGDNEVRVMYCFTDIYNNNYWSEVLEQ